MTTEENDVGMKMPEFGGAPPPPSTLPVKEIVMGSIVLVLFILFATFAGVFSAARHEQTSLEPQAQKGRLHDKTCFSKTCLEISGYTMSNMNLTANPCEDFYNYACGNYKRFHKVEPDSKQTNLFTRMTKEVKDKLKKILESDVKKKEWATEKKLKMMFQSCNDDYQLEKKKGKPLIDQFLNKMRGWYVLANWDPSTYDLNGILKVVQADFMVDALFSMRVYTDIFEPTKTAIRFYPAGTGRYMRWSYYTSSRYEHIRQAYKAFIARVASLVVRDSGVTMSPNAQADKINTFVEDVFFIEQQLATLGRASSYNYAAFQDANQISLDDLTSQTKGVIRYTEQASYFFEDSKIGGDKKTIVTTLDYLKGLSDMINGLSSRDSARKMHNYMVWRVMEEYVMDLSWEYVHANREIYVAITGQTEFLGKWNYCFNFVGQYMSEALGALFIADHFVDQNKAKVVEITEKMKTALLNMLDKTPWMDADTRKIAETKIKKADYRLGYPDGLEDNKKIDDFYKTLEVDGNDYFGNVLNLNQFLRKDWNRELKDGEDISRWFFNTWDVNMAVAWYRNQVVVPAGMLQFPIYEFNLPHYFTFGAIGSFMGHFILHLTDAYGSRWDEKGRYLGYKHYWWTNATRTAYQDMKTCMVDAFNTTQGPFTAPDGSQVSFPIMSSRRATENIAIASGVRMSYNAYHLWEKEKGMEKLAPTGQDLTDDQLFFISYAQTNCFNRNDQWAFRLARAGRIREDYKVNLVLSQLPEFSKAFKCQAKSKLNPPNKCALY